MTKNMSTAGHRQRLRQRFLAESGAFTDAQLLELLLTYAIPRQDVVPIATRLLETFGSLEKLFAAPHEELMKLDGIGEAAAILLETAHQLQQRLNAGESQATAPAEEEKLPMNMQQQELFQLPQGPESDQATSPKPPPPPPTKADIRSYTNDLIKVALTHLPAVVDCDGFTGFSAYLEQNLPYNSANTRNRYTRYLTNRYYPDGTIATPLTKLLSFSPDPATWKAVLFYETVRAEPAVQFTAEQVIWPVLPTGYIEREILKESLQKRFSEASEATVSRMIYSLVNLYTLLDVAVQQDSLLKLQTRPGTLAAFAYVLAAEFPQMGIYSFEALEQGPMRRWLLWDREWMRRQLYNLRDMGVIAKISEIDAMRQFTLSTDQLATIQHYFGHPQRDELALRESPTAVEGES